MKRGVSFSGHGDLAAEADQAGSRTGQYRFDAFGQPRATTTITGPSLFEGFTGVWGEKLDPASGLVEMDVRPYDPALGRFYSVDPVDGGSANHYDYALQDPVPTATTSAGRSLSPSTSGRRTEG